MIPLSYFLLAWFVLLGIYALMTLLSLVQMLRFGLSGAGTFLTTVVFVLVAGAALFGTSAYLVGVDWSQGVDVFGGLRSSVIFNP